MKESRKVLLGVIMAVVLVIGLVVVTWNAKNIGDEKTSQYKSLVGSFDDSIRTARLGGNPIGALKSGKDKYASFVSGENFDNGYLFSIDNTGMIGNLNQGSIPKELKNRFEEENHQLSEIASLSVKENGKTWEISDKSNTYVVKKGKEKLNVYGSASDLYNLNVQIKNDFNSLIFTGENKVSLDNLRDLKGNVSTMAGQLGISLPFTYGHSALVVLLFSIPLAFLGNYLCRRLVDWEKFEDAKKSLQEWREKVREAKRKRGKKRRKLELRDEEAKNEEKKLWAISIKQAVFYLALFTLFFGWIGYVYGGWIVAWLPFNWFSSMNLVGVSLDYFAWFVLTYFGFAYIWRVVLLPER